MIAGPAVSPSSLLRHGPHYRGPCRDRHVVSEYRHDVVVAGAHAYREHALGELYSR